MQSGLVCEKFHDNKFIDHIEMEYFMDMMSDAVLLLQNNKVVKYNQIARHTFMIHGADTLHDKSIFDLFAHDTETQKERYFLCLQEAEAIGKSSTHWEFKRSDEALLLADVRIMHQMTAAGEMFLLFITDITDYRELIEEKQISDLKFEQLFNNSADSIFLMNLDGDSGLGTFIEVNDTMVKNLNIPKYKLLTMGLEDINSYFNFYKNDMTISIDRITSTLLENRQIVFECSYPKEGIVSKTLEINAQFIYMADQQAVLGVARDITERKAYQEKMLLQNEFFGQLFEKSPSAIAMIDNDDCVMRVNEAFCNLFEYDYEEVEGQAINDLIVSQTYKREGELFSLKTLSGGHLEAETYRMAKSGRLIPLAITAYPVMSKDKKIALYAIYTDITRRKKYEDRLQIFVEVFENNTEAVMIMNPDKTLLWWNKAFNAITGFTDEDIVDKDPDTIGMYTEGFLNDLVDTVKESGKWQGEIWGVKADGDVYPQWFNMFTIIDEDQATKYYVAIFSDITDIKLNEEKINYLSFRDSLTGLYNRTFFKDTLKNRLFSNVNGDNVALLFIDLDDFKYINDNVSHSAGDEILKFVAEQFSGCLRESDLIARYGGDEFIIMLTHFNQVDDAVMIGERIIEKLSQPIFINDMEIYINASVGLSTYPEDGLDCDSLIKNAEIAMYKAKETSKSNLQVYSEDLNERIKEKYYLKNALRNALRNEEIYLVYQPIVDTSTNRIVGCEALARWHNPEMGNIPPSKFIPLAEKGEEILTIGKWILNEACKQNRRWHLEGHHKLFISVNISPKQLEAGNFVDVLRESLDASGLEPEYLELEITESIPMKNPEKAMVLLDQIRSLGVRISMDDFGTGYSSLSQMNDLSLSKLKIDKCFVDDIRKNGVIISTIIAMANSLELTVVAEGVENEEQLEFLRKHHCDMLQGYYYSKPLESRGFRNLLMNELMEFGGINE